MPTMLLIVVFVLIQALVIVGQKAGWRMVDRFHGFRFELSGDKLDQDVLELIQTEADNYSCFGWAQLSAKGTVVGEMRCPKARGKVLEDKVTKISPKVHKADILVMQPPVHAFLVLSLTIPLLQVYPDTKIRLHFTSFKLLEADRDTCFLDPPHQCSERVTKDKAAAGERHGADEL